ncbi:pyruvate kinase 1, cytosolic-like [Chenopodium quinoa]|uniref:Pyruvate kinase n=1 Tax=Chenopodium quinoa TaxID=63459 RepID=A0A803MJ93_CHEQI|nr:pyruvate kinase 1, cytosolic-like [Chenopodium quinoa]
MQGGQMMLEEPVRLSSVLTPTKSDFSPSLTKVMVTLGPKSRSVETIEACLNAGMSVARFDFSCFDSDYHQETIDNLRAGTRKANKLCAVMLDTVGPEILVSNKTGNPVELKADNFVTITPDTTKEPSSEVLPINYVGFAKEVKKGDTVFLGQYLFTGSETSSVWLEVSETKGADIICQIKNSATLTGLNFNLHISGVQADSSTLTDIDKQIISTWGSHNKVDIISLHYTRHADDVREVRAFLAAHNLQETQIYAKVETVEGLKHFDEILKESDGVILARGNLGVDLPPEKVFLFQKSAAYRCNMAGKPLIITRVVDSMFGNLRPTRAEATDVANAVLDGADGILLGGETFGGLYPIEAIKTVRKICSEAEYVYNQELNFKRIVNYAGEPLSHAESVASSAVRVAIKVHAAMIAVFTSSGAAARLISKYRPSIPIFAIVTPLVKSNTIKWSVTGSMQARQLLGVRGVFPLLASAEAANIGVVNAESVMKLVFHHGKTMGLLRPKDKVVVFQKIGDSSVVEIVEFDD